MVLSGNGFDRPSTLGYKFVLTMTDYFSKYVEATPIIDKSADSVAKGFTKFTASKMLQSI